MIERVVLKVFFYAPYVVRGESKRMKTGAERGILVALLDEPYLALLFNYLPSQPSAPAVEAMSVVVTVAYIAAVVEVSLACLCSQLRFIAKPQCQELYALNP
jgi:hypothetical protein